MTEVRKSVSKVSFHHANKEHVFSTSQATTPTNASKKNPFTLPNEDEIFALRDEEKRAKQKELEMQKTMKVHEKLGRRHRKNLTAFSSSLDPDEIHQEEADKREIAELTAQQEAAAQTLAITTRDRNIEREQLADYIAKKREMFLVQYSLGVKRQEIRKLEQVALTEEQKLEDSERNLELDAAKFDNFLKENDRTAVEAIKQSDAQTKLKLEKVAEIKALSNDLMQLKSEISKNEDVLREIKTCRDFLFNLSPKDFQEDQLKRRESRLRERSPKRPARPPVPHRSSATAVTAMVRIKNLKPTKAGNATFVVSTPEAGRALESAQTASEEGYEEERYFEDEFEDESSDLYFKDPTQLLIIFHELEEHNLSLIQNAQELEETLQDLSERSNEQMGIIRKQTQFLEGQISQLEDDIEKERERTQLLQERTSYFASASAEIQEREMELLDQKVEEVYRNCIGENEANINTLQMLTNLENKLEELFEKIEKMPEDKVLEAEKAKDKQRRLRQREEKIEAQRKHQEERVKKALERAQAEAKKMTGKKLVFRSAPPQPKENNKKKRDQAAEEAEEERKYFFEK